MLADVNAVRARAGMPALVLDPKLCRVAAAHDIDMARRHYFGHDSPEGISPFDRMRAAFVRYSYAGENIALAASEPSALRSLLGSPDHLENILQRHYRRVGIAAVRLEPGGDMIFVQDFAG